MKKIGLLITLIVTIGGRAQELTVFYKEKRRAYYSELRSRPFLDISNDELDMIEATAKTHRKELSKFEYTSVLRVERGVSLYYPQEKITNDTINTVVSYGKDNKDFISREISEKNHSIIYINLDTDRKISTEYAYGRNYLISENLSAMNWIVTNMKKTIHGYQCKKAILKIADLLEYDKGFINRTPIEVWYTEEIPIEVGPIGLWGLPGLILEVHKNGDTITVDRIIPKLDGFKIKPPTEGRRISRADRDILQAILFNEN